MKPILVLLMLFISGILVFSQNQNIHYREITYENGVDDNDYGSAMLQDSKGFIWIAKVNTLQRYDGYAFKDYMLNTGIYSLSEGRNGLIWAATDDGICIIDPENDRMQKYSVNSGRKRINKVIEDDSGIIYGTTFNGLLKMVPKVSDEERLRGIIFNAGLDSAFAISTLKPEPVDSIAGANIIYEIFVDSQERLWTGSSDGLYVNFPGTNDFVRIDDDENGQTRLNDPFINNIIEENSDLFWVRTQNGISRISNLNRASSGRMIDKSKLEIMNYMEAWMHLGQGYFTNNRFFLDKENNLWVGSTTGLKKMHLDGSQNAEFEQMYHDLNQPEGVQYHMVTSIMEDRTGLIWTGHQNPGIRIFRDQGSPFARLDTMLIEHQAVFNFNQIYKDDHDNLWVCTWGSGLFKISKDGNIGRYQIDLDRSLSVAEQNRFVTLAELSDGVFWIGTGRGIRQVDTRTGKWTEIEGPFSEDVIKTMKRIGDHMLIGGASFGLYVYHLKTGKTDQYTANQNDSDNLIMNSVLSLNQMKNGEIWITFPSGKFNRVSLNETTGELEFLSFSEIFATLDSSLFEDVNIIYRTFEDSQGSIWFCTDAGLLNADFISGNTRKWTKKEGLYSNQVSSVQEDHNGRLWIGTAYGLSMLDPSTGIIKTFDETDGIPAMKHSDQCTLIDDEGLIYFGGWGGLYRIDPVDLPSNESVPPVVITDFRLFNRSVEVGSGRKAILTSNIPYTKDIHLSHGQHDISLTFAALDYNDPSKNRYAYILEGYQEEWIETDAGNRTATYTNLSPGKYTFRVKGSNNDGVWNEEGASVNIFISPPFWKTTLAYIAYGIIFLLLLRGYIFWRTRRLRNDKIKLEQQVSERTQRIEIQKDELKIANTLLQQHEKELEVANGMLEKNQEELRQANTQLNQQKEEQQATIDCLQMAQDQLVESEKMAAVGGLVAGVAHEINTPVGVGITAISNLQDEIQRMTDMFENGGVSKNDFREFLHSSDIVAKLIQRNLDRTAKLVQRFKQISADQITEQQRFFVLKEYLNDILISLRPKFNGKKLDIKIECEDELKLNSYPGVFVQIFNTLLLNSLQHGFDHMEEGRITIFGKADKKSLEIQYADNGSGINPNDLPHIFEPFYTSDHHRGTGLGLNIIYNLVRQKLRGSITCESEPGKGVLFKIKIPLN